MFSANTQLQVTGTDFDTIKSQFRDFISQKTEFKDYDFQGSTLNYMLDILAYNTYQNAFYTNMAVNENFLDTAQIRSNVVSHAKKLGYVPNSAKSSYSTLTVSFNPPLTVSSITMPKFTRFQSKNEGTVYNYYTLNSYTFSSSANFTGSIVVYEGDYVKQTFIANGTISKFSLPNNNINLDSLIVEVKDNSTTTNFTTYSRATDLTELDSSSTSYFVEESVDETYDLFFGDGVLGKKIVSGNVVTVQYLNCSGVSPNGSKVFVAVSNGGYNTISPTDFYQVSTISNVIKSQGGSEKEEINSIKFNAPRYYTRQNRLVTAPDYKNFITEKYPFISSVIAWGGESNVPSIPGRIILSIKPTDGYILSETQKTIMINDMKKRNVLSIEPIIVDPLFIYVNPVIKVNYISRNTTLSSEEIFNKIALAVQDFEQTNLGIFGNKFVASKFISLVDDADASIEGNDTTFTLEKRFSPIIGSYNTYNLKYNASIYHPYDGFLGAITSTGFKINNNANTLYMDDDGKGNILFYYFVDNTSNRSYLTGSYGTVNYETGIITLTSIQFADTELTNEIRVRVIPASNNIDSPNNQIILLSLPEITLYDKSTSDITYVSNVDVSGDITPVASNGTTSTLTL